MHEIMRHYKGDGFSADKTYRLSFIKYLSKYCRENRWKKKDYIKKYYNDNKEKISANQKVYKKQNKDEIKSKASDYYKLNKEKIKNRTKKYREDNLQKTKEKSKEYRLKDESKKRHNAYKKNKRDSCKLNKLKIYLRNRTCYIFKKKQFIKSQKTTELLGIDIDVVKTYIESKFTKGMTWDNYGKYGWHIDHIIPLSTAKTEEDLRKLCHYTNLQPLWAQENISKGAKIPKVQLKLTI